MAKDPYRYFRIEARELVEGLGKCVLDLEKAPADRDALARMLRLAHTLKGASRVVKLSAVAEGAHAVEDVLAAYRETNAPVSQEDLDRVLGLVDAIGARLAAIDPSAEPVQGAALPRATEESTETVRVEIGDVDVLLESLTEATVLVNALGRQSATLANAQRIAEALVEQLHVRMRGDPVASGAPSSWAKLGGLAEDLRGSLERVGRDVGAGVEQVGMELREVRDAANRLRLMPASAVFPSLERAARDAARALDKTVSFEATGGTIRIDAHVLTGVRDALIHAVRNAVDHGIEAQAARASAGKPAGGRITLSVERRGHHIAFLCRDDGRGVDVEAVRQAAVRRGRWAPGSPSPDAETLLRLLLEGGMTTAATVTEVSGRGVGLDVVRETAARLKGEVSLRSQPGAGTELEIRVPVSLASVPALLVDAGGSAASLPLDSVRQTLRLVDADIARSADSDSIVYEGNVIPFVPLATTLQRTSSEGPRRRWSAVVVQSGAAFAAFGVDRLVGTASVVMRPLPAHAEVDAVVAGAALDAEGNPQLVLDPEGLVAAAQRGRGARTDGDASARAPILVVDDSLTTRMLEQSILESAGYDVELANSAEEALEKAAHKRYALFVVDVEMPGMDGFGFVSKTRADPVLRETPAILVTSRGSPEDRRRGADAGARGYIVKGEFDQNRLLLTIRDLVGEGRA